ncbi:TlpA family protein disulfide reductase [Aurantibacter crassamenti]|uniref:TlpA family protein disulfide reductase n=1 Tax=Aurantibacter crassamenti TaxID=1837375 RepID=UPI00193ADB2B|nr:TlpA disulfide reductase family protein [Aurantibacter crassamenti]MBM1105368.1 TlpA family protein disulfide reductase [Aurantibacter crassamenti]
MKKKHLTVSNIIFAIFIVLLIIPQTRVALQVAVNKVRVFVFSPSVLNQEDQAQLPPFTYQLTKLNGDANAVEVGQGEVTFISYWATWCPPCIAELPSIVELHEDYGDKVNFLLLTNENPEKVRAFLEKKAYDLPVYIPKMEAPDKLISRSIPTNYIIDKKGKILIKETGAADWNSTNVRAVLNAAKESK